MANGYEAIAFERVDAPVVMGKSLDDAVAFQLAIGPAGEIYREAGKIAEQRHDEIVAALNSQASAQLLYRRPCRWRSQHGSLGKAEHHVHAVRPDRRGYIDSSS